MSILSTFNQDRMIKIYNSYISIQEREKLFNSLRKIKDEHMQPISKSEYLWDQEVELGYYRRKGKADGIIRKYKPLLEEIKNNTFLDKGIVVCSV
ncbi:hypothetical protein BIY23_01565 [Wolbachia pipientis]|uniref:Uncharacterized protein n=1 Tax=Wolbachia pipientis TaxID=955 RepID=A0A1E7QKZ6_WOLPI|nr:hypothetical protein [Wolbachia pipientis]OEY87148.1 hypothetical protein BIY23_01565 [Wolbachia pipientis]